MSPEDARALDRDSAGLPELAPEPDALALLDAVALGWLPAEVLARPGHPAAGGARLALAPGTGAADEPSPGDRLALRDGEGVLLALLDVERVRDDEGAGGRPAARAVDGRLTPVRARAAWTAPGLRLGPQQLLARLAGRAAAALVLTAPESAAARDLAAERLRATGGGAVVVRLVLVDGDGPGTDPTSGPSALRVRLALDAAAPAGTGSGTDVPAAVLVPSPVHADVAARSELARLLASALGAEDVQLDDALVGDDAGVPTTRADGGAGRAALVAAAAGDEDAVRALLPPAVAEAVLDEVPPPARQGVVVLLSGLSGSGKSTVAQVLAARLAVEDRRRVTLLDGDVVRRSLTAGLGFGRADRETNVRRIGWVAALVAHHGGVALAAPIAPHDAVRRAVRGDVEAAGGQFVLVHVSTPIEVCEARDRKGLYAAARAGRLTGFTGVDDPYEEPADADVVVDTSRLSAPEAAARVVDHLRVRGLLGGRRQPRHAPGRGRPARGGQGRTAGPQGRPPG